MATLRNKTTEDGSIVRWKPHPDHARPSTYQITPRALGLLNDMGYSAPARGDEVEIPPDSCRPLRIVGDLYFKSEQPGEVDLRNTNKISKRQTESLSNEQREILWSYIESHPQNTGKAQKLLSGKYDPSPSKNHSTPTHKSSSKSCSGSQTPGIIPSKNIHVGQIHRFSNASNAMFKPRVGREFNIGSLPRSTEGKTTIGAQYAENRGLSLTPQLWTSSYRKRICDSLDEFGERIGVSGLAGLIKIRDRSSPAELSSSDITVYLSVIGDGFGIGFRGPWTVIVLNRNLTTNGKIRVEVVDEYDEILIARPIPLGEDSEPVGIGSEVSISVDQVDDRYITGTIGTRIVQVPRTVAQPNRSLQAAITEIDAEHILASVSALEESSRPTEGELITLEDGEIVGYSDIPVITPKSLPDMDIPLSLVVDSIETDGVQASVGNIRKHRAISTGQELSVKVATWDEGIGKTAVEGVPLQIEGGRPLLEVPILTKVIEFTEGFVRSQFIRADVPIENTKDVERLLQIGNQHLQNREYEESMATFSTAVELAIQKNSSNYGRARIGEILAICEQLRAQNDTRSGINYIDTINTDVEELSKGIRYQLQAYRNILQAHVLISEARSADSITATNKRSDAKQEIKESVIHLSDTEDSGTNSPHPVVLNLLATTAEQLLVIPDTVTQYLESVPTL